MAHIWDTIKHRLRCLCSDCFKAAAAAWCYLSVKMECHSSGILGHFSELHEAKVSHLQWFQWNTFWNFYYFWLNECHFIIWSYPRLLYKRLCYYNTRNVKRKYIVPKSEKTSGNPGLTPTNPIEIEPRSRTLPEWLFFFAIWILFVYKFNAFWKKTFVLVMFVYLYAKTCYYSGFNSR